MLAAGEVVEGRWAIRGLLGMGGSGEVYDAVDLQRGARAALKRLRQEAPDALERLRREFRALAGLSHPNLMLPHELFSAGGSWWLAMDRAEGVDFRTWARGAPAVDAETLDALRAPAAQAGPAAAAGRLDEGRLRSALRQLAGGVRALHLAGRVHRDLKPAHAIVSPQGRLQLIDYGLAGPAGDEPGPRGGVSGTPSYMAPEQAAGFPLGPAADWYAVGTMLYEALAGALPFAGAARDVLRQKQEHDPPPPQARAPGLPSDLCQLCVDLLRRDPAARPDGAAVLQRLGGESPPTPALSRLGGVELAGRQREQEALRRAWGQVLAGEPQAVRLRGPAGSGRTAVLRAFLDERDQRGDAACLELRAAERERVPGKPLDGFAAALRQAGLPVPPLSEPPTLPELAQALRASSRPALLAVDDLQWADPAAVALLRALFDAPRPHPLLLLAADRTGWTAPSPAQRAWDEAFAGRGRDLGLAPLEDAAMAALAAPRLTRERQDLVPWVVAQSAGSPFLARLLCRAARELPPGPPPTLVELLASRLARMRADERALLALAAAAGPAPQTALERASGLDERAGQALLSLRAGRFLRCFGAGPQDPVDVYAEPIRAAALRGLTPGQVEGLRRKLG